MAIQSARLMFVCGAALVSAMCHEASPTGPTPTSSPAPAPAPTPSPVAGAVEVSAVPNPVPFSGQPVIDAGGCAGLKNTWFYDQVLAETGGSEVTFRSRLDTFDGFLVNNLTGLTIVVPAHSSTTLHVRWCSGVAADHSAQSSFTGTDAGGNVVTVKGPSVTLLKPLQ